MEKIISYDELPKANKNQLIYLRMEETDPKLYLSLFAKGYRIVRDVLNTDDSTIFITRRRQDYQYSKYDEYKKAIDINIQNVLRRYDIVKPKTTSFSYDDLISHKYKVPFVLKNENQNGGREKFLISTEEDYEALIKTCALLIRAEVSSESTDIKSTINYDNYLHSNFVVQEYIQTPSNYNTTVRLLTSSSNDLLYASLKYSEPCTYVDNTSLLGVFNSRFQLGTKSIVSNTLYGGKNVLIGESNYSYFERSLLRQHDINSNQFCDLVSASQLTHCTYKSELGIICAFDYIYDKERKQWFLLEYHSKPMVGDYSKKYNVSYVSKDDQLTADGRVRATAPELTLRKTK